MTDAREVTLNLSPDGAEIIDDLVQRQGYADASAAVEMLLIRAQADAYYDEITADPEVLAYFRAEVAAAIAEDDADPDGGITLEAFRQELKLDV